MQLQEQKGSNVEMIEHLVRVSKSSPDVWLPVQ